MGLLVGLCSLLFIQSHANAQNLSGWKLVWSDEFSQVDGSAPDPDNWIYDTGGGGWGNNEIQYYTTRRKNSRIVDGQLLIEAHEESYGGRNHTSARLLTKGKHAWTYGRFEARIKVPSGSGLWPAFWMLGVDIDSVGWPQCGEIDIMEYVGREPKEVFGTIHGPNYSGGASFGDIQTFAEDVADDYHVYAVEWEEGQIRWYVDGTNYHNAVPSDLGSNEWVFDHDFFILLNLAIAGNFGGPLDPAVTFPRQMWVDYVRVYQRGYEVNTNVLLNPGFEGGALAPWTGYTPEGANSAGGTVESSDDRYYNGGQPGGDPVLIHNGAHVAKIYGDFTGSPNQNGFYQELSAEAGSVWSAGGWVLTHPQDLLAGQNSIWVEVTFRDENGAELALHRSPVLDSSGLTPAQWREVAVSEKRDPQTEALLETSSRMQAPDGTTKVRFSAVFSQPGNDAGAIYLDDLSLVLEALPARMITASAGSGGSINPVGSTEVEDGGNLSFTIVPDAGYEIAEVRVDGMPVGSVEQYTFNGVAADHTIHAVFSVEAFTLDASAGTGGAIEPAGALEVPRNSSQSYVITPDAGFRIARLLVDGQEMEAANSFSFFNVSADRSIRAEFEVIPGVTVVALDLGPTDGPLYDGTFDGASGFQSFGAEGNGGPHSPSLDIGGGVTLAFRNVGGWDNTGPDAGVNHLLHDHLYSGGGVPADNPVSFTLSGLDPSDTLRLEFVENPLRDALVTFAGGPPVLIDGGGSGFVDVSAGGVTGSSSYSGSFTGGSGSGEGNLAAARIMIIPSYLLPGLPLLLRIAHGSSGLGFEWNSLPGRRYDLLSSTELSIPVSQWLPYFDGETTYGDIEASASGTNTLSNVPKQDPVRFFVIAEE